MVELCGDLVTKEPACASGTYCPCVDVLRVTPYQVTECTLMRNLLGSGDDPDLINGADFRAEAAVYAKDCSVHNGSEHKEVEYLAASFPDRCVSVFRLTFFVEAVHLCNLS